MTRPDPISTQILAVFAVIVASAGCGGGARGGEDTSVDQMEEPIADTADVPDAGDEESVPCVEDSDCDDGIFCNGAEACGASGTCEPGEEVACDDSDPCTSDMCDEDTASCDNEPLDEDGDGYVAAHGPGSESCGGDDCDDGSASAHPGAIDDGCDLEDLDCDGSTDERIDDDHDGWIDNDCDGVITEPAGYAGLGDCDDAEAATYPGAPEACDGNVDNDCDGDATEIETDADHDGYGALSCGGSDCDDASAGTHPGATELCDMVDQDCDGSILDAAGIDGDADGVVDVLCGGPDCDDSAPSIHAAFEPGPGITDPAVAAAAEICDDVDQDCDGTVLDAEGADDDGDGWLDPVCDGSDCDDEDPATYPGAPEDGCDSVDNDCDGTAVEGWVDQDGDGYINEACGSGDDCDDLDPEVHPGADTTCDLVDDDCTGTWRDETDADDDGDGWLDAVCGGDDCDDTVASVHPGAAEDGCDAVDDDCDGDPVDGVADADGDDSMGTACGGADCDDDDPTRYPGAAELCDDIDQDCDGSVWDAPGIDDDDDGFAETSCGGSDCDDDDPFANPAMVELCDLVDNDCNGTHMDAPGIDDDGDTAEDATCGGTDCDDGDPTRYPGAVELCDDIDQDCDGSVWDAPGIDDDGDGYADTSCGGSDCDDDDPFVNPGVAESCGDLADNDCNAHTDLLWAVPGTTRLSTGSGDGRQPDVAWSTSGMGVVWRDARDGNEEIYFVRLMPDASVGGTEVRVTSQSAVSQDPCLAWSGTQFGVAWSDERDGNAEIYFARLTSTGGKSGSDVRITTSPGLSLKPSIAWTGSEFGVAWHDDRTGDYEVYFARVSGAGVKTGTDVRVTSSAGLSAGASLVWAGSLYALAWHDAAYGDEEIMLATISPDGVPGTNVRVTSSTGAASSPSMAWDRGTGLGIAWREDVLSNLEIMFAYMSLSGTRLTSDVCVTSTATASENPSLVFDRQGTAFALAYDDEQSGDREISLVQIATDGTLGSVLSVTTETGVSNTPCIADTGASYAVVWKDDRITAPEFEIFSILVSCF